MPRSGARARDRLEQAALELYSDRGFDRTTTAAIAARAGVTERTFFRHFADKREVFFNVEASLQAALARAFADVPESVPPVATMLEAFRASTSSHEDNRSAAQERHRVISATSALRERELTKAAALGEVVADALRSRGLADQQATLLAHVGTAALGWAIQTWLSDPSTVLDDLIVEAFADLREFFIRES